VATALTGVRLHAIGGLRDHRRGLVGSENGGVSRSSFGAGGCAYFEVNPNQSEVVRGLTLTSSGKIVAVDWSGTHGVVVRYNANGTHDSTFGANGVRWIDHPTLATDALQHVAIDASGRSIVVGSGL
jgi:hypothetical protein